MGIQANLRENDLVLFHEYTDSGEAYIAAGVLDASGVPAIVDNAIMGTIFSGLPAVGGFRVMVRRKDLALANSIMADNRRPDNGD